jgi:hypothetical protein
MRVARVLAIRDGGEGHGGSFDMDASGAMEVQRTMNVAPPPPDVRPGMTTNEVQVRAAFALAPN